MKAASAGRETCVPFDRGGANRRDPVAAEVVAEEPTAVRETAAPDAVATCGPVALLRWGAPRRAVAEKAGPQAEEEVGSQ
ncbi:hypothetical protein MUK42_11416 [Musa troglodytarum]|uniref:Uncharacterized protein n=1 Tax=Musa troglodytarum TaxID=320322 RepID=A0A9E7H0F5_9LILI|nr:hypothetical protein MUK42_11416 [Musa troglodytarum]